MWVNEGRNTLREGHYSLDGGSRTRASGRVRRPRLLSARGFTAGFVSVTAATAFLAAAGTAQAASPVTPVGAAAIVPPGAARIGPLAGSTTLPIEVALNPRNPSALDRYANEVSTPGSALFRHYIKPSQFAPMFGPTSATISSVYAALRSRGLNPGAISSDHLSIPVTATAAQIESAFSVNLASYRRPGGGTGFANTTAPKLPASVAGDIQAVIGLDNLTMQRPLNVAPSRVSGVKAAQSKTAAPAVPAAGPKACAASLKAQSKFHTKFGFTSFNYTQLANAYEFTGLYQSKDLGRNVSVGIVEFGEPNSNSDIATFQRCYRTHVKVSYVKVDGFSQSGPGEGEAALDIETVLATAPAAHIFVYRSPNTGAGVFDDYKTIVSQDKVRIVSISYGLCEHYQNRSEANAITTLFKKAAVQGQTIVASSGDSGSEACLDNDHNKNRLSANFPASDPYVLGVGGTAITKLTKRPGEVVWNDGYDGDGAGGGGKSVFFSEPRYQKSFKISSKVREVPDVSADADVETGYMIFHSGHWNDIGGTSAAAPLWGAFLALTDAKCPKTPVGWANSAIYFAASPKVKAIVINDIAAFPKTFPDNVNNNFTHFKPGNLYPVKNGYDAATGLGSPVGAVLASTLCQLDKK
jgi:subtilase family serine protease